MSNPILVCPACTYANKIFATVTAHWDHEAGRWQLCEQERQPQLECVNCDHQFEAWPEGIPDPAEGAGEPTVPGMDDRLSSFDYELIADALDCLDPDGSEQTARKQELEAWARQMSALGRGYLPPAKPGINAPPIRVLVAVEGGNVQGAVADREGVTVTVLDYDTEGADADRVFSIPQRGEGFAPAYRSEHEALADVAFIDGALTAELDEPEEAIEELRTQVDWSKADDPLTRRMGEEAVARLADLEARLPELLAAKAEREAANEEQREAIRQRFAAIRAEAANA